jgi:predicted transcriptional regulator
MDTEFLYSKLKSIVENQNEGMKSVRELTHIVSTLVDSCDSKIKDLHRHILRLYVVALLISVSALIHYFKSHCID